MTPIMRSPCHSRSCLIVLVATPAFALVLPVNAGAEALRHSPYVITPDEQFVHKGGNDLISDIIYVNDCKPDGCFIKAGGYNDARDDISTIPREDTQVSPFSHDQQVWDDTIACLRQVYAPYNVRVVTDNPGDALHHEAILAGFSSELGLAPEIGGVAPFSCQPQNNAISFSFANQLEPDWVDLCWTVAQESAHAFALDHAFECLDPMTYIPNCGQKFFRNKDLSCGEIEERACICGGLVQNSHTKLLQVFGEGTPAPPPQVAILLPAEGTAVSTGFVVLAEAQDQRLVDRVELHINGWLYETRPGGGYWDRFDDYQFSAPASLPDGIMDVDIKAYNDLGSSATARVTVTKGAPCASADTCLDGQQCNEGRCMWPAPTGQLGDTCERAMDCVSLLCPQNGEIRLCSEYCLPQLADPCPSGFECMPAGQSGVCWPAAGEGGCCSVGTDRGPSGGQLALLGLVAAVILRRRKRA
jgi:MYXO-CTERM domain-containing protein